jgi:uncharacterized cupin superfamily protein
MKEVSPFRTNMRVIEISIDNVTTTREDEPKRQKMAVVGVQETGTLGIVEHTVGRFRCQYSTKVQIYSV